MVPKPVNMPPEGSHRLPGLSADLKRTYEGLVRLGASTPASARPLGFLAKQLKESKHDMEHELRMLEGKGVVGHQTSGHETLWYVRK